MRPFILTIDDDVDFNRIMKLRIEEMGLGVETTETPEVFLKRVKSTIPDLCIIDLNLDKNFGAGFQLIKAIRKSIGVELPLFIMSKRSSREDISYALELGANEYLTKPLDELVLKNKIKQYLDTQAQDHIAFFKVPDAFKKCHFDLKMRVRKINEFGIYFEGDHLMSKGTTCNLTGKVVTELTESPKPLTVSIHNSWYDSDSGLYGAFFEFDPYDEALTTSVRRWLAKHNAPGC